MSLPLLQPEHFCDLDVELGPIRELGDGRGGKRRIIPIIGGRVHGPKLSGRILPIGADWQTVFDNGPAELDTRYAMETDDGATIEIVNYGFRHGPKDVIARIAAGEEVSHDSYYMRTHARLETGSEAYRWVNQMLFVGTGMRRAQSVFVSLYCLQ